MRLASVIFGERTHEDRVVGDESRVDAPRFDVLSNQFVDHPCSGPWSGAFDLTLHKLCIQIVPRLFALQRQWNVNSRIFLKAFEHRYPFPWRCEVHHNRLCIGIRSSIFLLCWHCQLVAAGDTFHHPSNHFLGDVHEVIVIRICPVELTRSELRVVSQVNTFISELAPNLVHTVHPSNDESFEIKFRSDAHVHFHLEFVMQSLERPRCGSSGDHVHHGGFDLQESSGIEVATDVVDDGRSDLESLTHAAVQDEVQIPLAKPHLFVSQADSRRRKHVEAWRKQLHLSCENTEFSCLGPSRCANDTHKVAPANNGHDLLELLRVARGL
mmetsp:Transcript_14905/g.26766  ORF Transcript_14905/g.26766 Transcript_14905/m.26766 type:complete len:326 (+) Transcript_14905:526-1503(+)